MQTDIIDQTMWAVSLQFDRRGFDSAPDLQPSQRFSFIALLDEAEVISVIFSWLHLDAGAGPVGPTVRHPRPKSD